MAAPISSGVNRCLKLFNGLLAESDLNNHEVAEDLWLDELGRFRVWAANIGAHQVGQSSLDYRLRDASHIKDQISSLLKNLQDTFEDLKEVLNESPEDSGQQSSDGGDMTELQQIYQGLVENINYLFRMSMLIRRPARHDRLLNLDKQDIVTYEPYDLQHVFAKFPLADRIVLDRLGNSISRRRADLKYRERHHQKLAKGINGVHDEEHHRTRGAPSTNMSDTIATDFKGESNIDFDDSGSRSGLSQTSYAQTLLDGRDAMTVPPPPKESANEQPFECPYCFFITTVNNKRSWARHVFQDITPYICIFPECSTPQRLYDSRRAWYQHLASKHTAFKPDTSQICPLCHDISPSAHHFERHLGRHLEELALFAIPRQVYEDDEQVHDHANELHEKRSTFGDSSASSSDAQLSEGEDAISAHPFKCICSYLDDDGNTVYCPGCATWQHIVCYFPDFDVPEEHLCIDCQTHPMYYDSDAAEERQKHLREQPGFGTWKALETTPDASDHGLDKSKRRSVRPNSPASDSNSTGSLAVAEGPQQCDSTVPVYKMINDFARVLPESDHKGLASAMTRNEVLDRFSEGSQDSSGLEVGVYQEESAPGPFGLGFQAGIIPSPAKKKLSLADYIFRRRGLGSPSTQPKETAGKSDKAVVTHSDAPRYPVSVADSDEKNDTPISELRGRRGSDSRRGHYELEQVEVGDDLFTIPLREGRRDRASSQGAVSQSISIDRRAGPARGDGRVWRSPRFIDLAGSKLSEEESGPGTTPGLNKEEAGKEKEIQREYVDQWQHEQAERNEKANWEKEKEDKKLADSHTWAQAEETSPRSIQEKEILQAVKRQHEMNNESNSLNPETGPPVYVRVNKKHLDPETLDHFSLPWEWAVDDSDYILIMEWISQDLLDLLIEHTRQLRIRNHKQLKMRVGRQRKHLDQ